MTGIDRIKVLVLHSDSVVEAGLMSIVARSPDMQLLQPHQDTVSDDEACRLCLQERVGVLVADYARALRIADIGHGNPPPPGTSYPRLLIYTDRATHAEIRDALAAGVHGYLLSGCSALDVSDGVRRVSRGMRHLSEIATLRLVEEMLTEKLTARETEVLSLVAAGYPNKLIADHLGVETTTVKVHVAAILEKLGARNRTEAVAIANQRGLFAGNRGASGTTPTRRIRAEPSGQDAPMLDTPGLLISTHGPQIEEAPFVRSVSA